MTDSVASYVAEIFPGRRITPGYFRRAIITFLVKQKLSSGNSKPDENWEKKLAVLMNTSPTVLHLYYIRYDMSNVNKQTLNDTNAQLVMVPQESTMNKLNQATTIRQTALEAQSKNAVAVINHEWEEMPHLLKFQIEYEDGQCCWLPSNEIHHLKELVAKYRSESPYFTSKEGKKKQPRKQKSTARASKEDGNCRSDPKRDQFNAIPSFTINDDDDFQVPKSVIPVPFATKPPVSPDKLVAKPNSPAKSVSLSNNTNVLPPTVDMAGSQPMDLDGLPLDAPISDAMDIDTTSNNIICQSPSKLAPQRPFFQILNGQRTDQQPPRKKSRISLSLAKNK